MHKNERIVIERILFPTDLTAGGEIEDGLNYAVALARTYRAKLILCHCVEPQAAPGSSGEAQRLFDELMAPHVQADTPFDWEGIVVEGEATAEIARLAAEQHIDVIVMHSRKIPRAAALLDSRAEAVSRTAPCPTLITHKQGQVRPGELSAAAGFKRIFKRILVAYDFSGDSELALTYGLSLAQEFQSELHLMHVLTTPPKADSDKAVIAPVGPDHAFQTAARRLWNAVPKEAYLWSEVKQVVSQGLPYREILAYARENDIDLICIGASGAGFGQWALFGSNSDRILRQAPCPVLVTRPLRPMALEASIAEDYRAAS